MTRLLEIAVVAALLAAPDLARACAVCTGGSTEEVRYAFLWTTGFLSVLPLALIGGLVFFLRRRAREIAEAAAAREMGRAGTDAPREARLGRASSSR